MWGDASCGWEAAEFVRAAIPYWLIITLPVLFLVAPEPAAAAHEYVAFRMLQHDLHGVPHGCRASNVNLEGRSLTSWSTSRHCVVARLRDLSIDSFLEIRSKAGALLLVLPANSSELTVDDREHIQHLEVAMSQLEVNIPVYLINWNPEAELILEDLQHSFITDEKSATALEAIVNTATANGYQIVVTAPAPAKVDSKTLMLHGKLAGRGAETKTVVISAHYDSSGIAPELATGSDSNASGAVALLELARIFSHLYADVETRPSASLLLVLPGTGPELNYFSTKKWLEEQLDSSEGLLHDVTFAMCLDSLSSSPDVRMHVSKPPRPGGAAASLLSRLGAPLHHKKINLADEVLAWQHERFSIRRMTAFTLSSLESHKDTRRGTILDVPSEKSLQNLVHNVRKIARALASHLYNLTNDDDVATDQQLYNEALSVDEASVRQWYYYLSSQSRAPHVTATQGTSPSGLSAALERALSRYAGEATVSLHSADKREPEYALYSPTRATLHVYSVKPAVFDLILTLAIIAYLALVYLAVVYFPSLYDHSTRYTSAKAKVQ